MSNIYYHPKDFGFEFVKDHDADGGCGFDTVIVLRRGDEYFVAHDSGCSCPIPFEDVKVGDLTPVKSLGDVDKFAREAWGEWRDEEDLNRHVAALIDGLRLGGGS